MMNGLRISQLVVLLFTQKLGRINRLGIIRERAPAAMPPLSQHTLKHTQILTFLPLPATLPLLSNNLSPRLTTLPTRHQAWSHRSCKESTPQASSIRDFKKKEHTKAKVTLAKKSKRNKIQFLFQLLLKPHMLQHLMSSMQQVKIVLLIRQDIWVDNSQVDLKAKWKENIRKRKRNPKK
jgi:hypothetical protein